MTQKPTGYPNLQYRLNKRSPILSVKAASTLFIGALTFAQVLTSCTPNRVQNEFERKLPVKFSYESIVQSLGEEDLGFGLETDGNGPYHQAMAYGLVASAASLVGDVDRAEAAAWWLVDNAKKSRGVGWGLGWEWDAFGDGSINSADTVYGITTAIAIEGLLSAYETTGIDEFMTVALEAADYYKQFMTETDKGAYFWYSEKLSDAMNVYNVSAMLAGAFARAGKVSNRQDLQEIAQTAAAEVLDHATRQDDFLSWEYREGDKRPNDILHAAYIVHGLVTVDRSMDERIVDRDALLHYIVGFQPSGGPPKEFRPDEVPDELKEIRARSWGLGMAAFVLQEINAREEALRILSAASDYSLPTGGFAYEFGGEFNVPRSTAHLLLGAAAYEVDY